LIKKNIVFFLPNFGLGGAAQSITNTVINLNRGKYNIYIFCLNNCAYKKIFLKKKIKIYEIKKERAIFSFLLIKKKIKQIIYETNLDTIFVSNINYANILSILFLSNIKFLKVITVDRTPIQELNFYYNNFFLLIKNIIIKLLIKTFYRKASTRIGNSKTLSDDLSKFTKSSFHTIYPYTLKKITPFKKKSFKKNNEIINIIWVGRLSREKSLETLIYAVDKLKKEKINIKIFGDGPKKKNYLNTINRLGLNKKIKFFGYKNNINNFLKNSDLYVGTSLYEGFQNSIIEAINNDVPVISTNSFGGVKDILKKNKFGHSYEAKDYNSLSKLIKKFIINPKPFIDKTKLAKKNLKKFEFHKTNHKYENIFDKI
jgi:glycosyltransferase involved in cell wall biosynthesis